jgi:hypothetical protein
MNNYVFSREIPFGHSCATRSPSREHPLAAHRLIEAPGMIKFFDEVKLRFDAVRL